MPELPEVQTVVNHLAGNIIGKVFFDSEVKAPKMVSRGFQQKLKGRKVIGVERRAKMIVINLSKEYLLVHLKMTGQLVFVDKEGKATGGGHPITSEDFKIHEVGRFTHIILNFKDGSRLLFHDVRKFGWMKLASQAELEAISERHGVEPLSKDFSLKKFKEILGRRPNLKIKQLLLDQSLIAGIGNIYADESLFAAGIRPNRRSGILQDIEITKLHQAIIKNLKAAIKLGGTSVNTFVSSSGQRGKFVEKLQVYGRGGKRCFNCNSILQKIKLAGRGTVYCPKCQK